MQDVIAGAPPRPSPAVPSRIVDLVGAQGWADLPARVRTRFGHAMALDFGGKGQFEATLAGRFFAFIGAAFGRPLPFHTGAADVFVTVRATPDGEVWTRTYRFARGEEVAVSVKHAGAGTWFEERAGPLIMRLRVFVENRVLVFECIDFLLRLGRVEIPVPLALTPGRIRVEHHDKGAGRFVFTLEARHPLFGRTFHQICDVEDLRIEL